MLACEQTSKENTLKLAVRVTRQPHSTKKEVGNKGVHWNFILVIFSRFRQVNLDLTWFNLYYLSRITIIVNRKKFTGNEHEDYERTFAFSHTIVGEDDSIQKRLEA